MPSCARDTAESRAHRTSGCTQLAPFPLKYQFRGRTRLPRHIGFIPDGNRRWAAQRGLAKEQGSASDIAPGVALFETCRALGIEQVSVFGFTQDNTRRPTAQANQFRAACVAFASEISRRNAALLVLGDEESKHFPAELTEFRTRQGQGIKVNFHVNYGWEWDLERLQEGRLRSADVSRWISYFAGAGAALERLPADAIGLRRHIRTRRVVAGLQVWVSGRCADLVW